MSRKTGMLAFAIYSVIFTVIFVFAHEQAIRHAIEQDLDSIKLRVALDKNRLPIAVPHLNYAGDATRVQAYIDALNDNLQKKTSRIRIVSIASSDGELKEGQLLLSGADGDTAVGYEVNTSHNFWLYIIPILIALLNLTFYKSVSNKREQAKRQTATTVAAKPQPQHLVVDLYSKTLCLSGDKTCQVQLANKPLCFYLALLEFCLHNPKVSLNQNKELPDELLDIADKYFHRLVALGHTIRKRPNFSNSLEKTLSEIRAALDELLTHQPDLRVKLYPPKAHGEGSRSKLHSYGLKALGVNDVEVIGK
ncbi:hypothetical protein [Pseudoalteromonas ardens]|uniref:Uncharacterized protein n=1 Tax=Pseudoalteromonas rubra TaxID=43658 RepID=A0A0L0ERU7_9GAMM|nr:hypothetical protein [Pseudoalteromonas sp. R96]KNC67080.1 hypothetical protein AC626_13035 [Pseudoalteromonas rubra]MDK1309910.1 hypothetical protein [Pseudoalteromonas sp. R96]